MTKKKILTFIIVIIIFGFLFNNIFQNWGEIKSAITNFSLTTLLLTFIVIGSLHFINALSWHLVTKAMNFKIGFIKNLRIWLLPNISRYIPGIVWQYLGRIYLLSKEGINKKSGMLAVAVDAIFTFGIGAFVVILTFTFQWILVAILLIPIGIVIVFRDQRLLIQVIKIINRFSKKDLSLSPPRFHAKWLIASSFVTFSQFIVAGTSLFLISSSLHPISSSLIPTFAGIYAGSWILGYISFFAPGGLGIQELSIAGLLSAFIPLPIASLTAIIFRFSLTIAEISIASLAFVTKDKS